MKKLALLPGLRWKGSLTIVGDYGDRYAVAFDAESTDPQVVERHIYDRTILTARQVEDWTGYRKDESHVALTERRLKRKAAP